MLNCIKNIKKKRKCDHEWQVYRVYLPAMRMKCLKCNKKKTVTFNALDFLQYWVKPYLSDPTAFKRYKKTIVFFETNKKQIIRNATEEIQQKINKLKKEERELEELKRFCEATATALL